MAPTNQHSKAVGWEALCVDVWGERSWGSLRLRARPSVHRSGHPNLGPLNVRMEVSGG